LSAGYSGSSLVRKLGVRPGARVALVNAPDRFAELLGELPDGVRVSRRLQGPRELIVAFYARRHELERRLPALRDALDCSGGLWLAWPKRSSGVETDLGERAVRDLGLAAGLVDNKICAIDQTWSALRFVYRLADRPGAST
jgi:hypothetical protein